MPRYHFHIRENGILREDAEGEEFEDIEHATEEAVRAARELLPEKVAAGALIDGQVFEITDELGSIVQKVSFRSVLRLKDE